YLRRRRGRTSIFPRNLRLPPRRLVLAHPSLWGRSAFAMILATHFFEPAPRRLTPPPGTLWILIHETEGSVSVNVGAHPHGYELRLVLNQRFLRSRVHESLSGAPAPRTGTR